MRTYTFAPQDYDSEDEAEEESERPSKSQGASNKIVFNRCVCACACVERGGLGFYDSSRDMYIRQNTL